jgi:hypothetical protein
MKEFIQKLILSILGVLFMAAFREFIPDPTIWHYLSLLLFILVFYYLIFPICNNIWKTIQKSFHENFPKIGILNGNIYSPIREHKCERGWTNVTQDMWKLKLKEFTKTKIQLIPTSKINQSFPLIINPFGDIFPEKDTKLHTTFYKICEYIKNGGIFVNTGGAFFSHQNPIHSVKHKWVFINRDNGLQSLKDSFFFQEFGVETTGDAFANGQCISKEPLEVEIYQKENDKNITGVIDLPKKIKRFRALTPQSHTYIPLIRQKDESSFPIALIGYGDGYILHAGIHLESEDSEEFKLLLNIIKNIVENKFKNI